MMPLRKRQFFGQSAKPVRDPEPEPLLHKFSSTQVQIVGDTAAAMQRMARNIAKSDLSAEGIEPEHHITVKYGVHFQTPSRRMREALARFGPVSATLGKTSLFQNDDADVLKLDVTSPALHRLNALIKQLSPTEDTHPKYIPHATLAYLKPGRGKKYAGNTALDGKTLTFNSIIFSGKRGHRESLPLTSSSADPFRAR